MTFLTRVTKMKLQIVTVDAPFRQAFFRKSSSRMFWLENSLSKSTQMQAIAME